eukprot:CAMPEP_0204138222 /NCGR_PEP_ID=MMETSP0361-20130328/17855_1 /ASSEMBLY_ACC=CAM_ASM_000343 /TAXON_ID=268821 /ORGANISM="Scrippsiella Hangoei, Strain SHTV-5" /LENGTH=206 /DNA_ID=CAMNT_0051092003 /DNA_START=39 /DNA_END=656 /DNA_ORIENTATION=-
MKFMYDVTPCLTCSRAQGHWVTNRGRRLTKLEQMRLQSIRTPAEGFKVVVSDFQLGRQIGNAMSVNILERLLVRILPAAGLALAGSLKDRWAHPASSASSASSSSSSSLVASATSGSKRKAAGDPKEVTQKVRNATRSLRAAHAKKMQLAGLELFKEHVCIHCPVASSTFVRWSAGARDVTWVLIRALDLGLSSDLEPVVTTQIWR